LPSASYTSSSLKGGADAVGDTAVEPALEHDRVDGAAAVVRGDIAEEADAALAPQRRRGRGPRVRASL